MAAAASQSAGTLSAGRELPYNLEAETAVLEAVLRDNSTLATASAIISPHDFFREAHKVIFGCMSDMSGRGLEIEEISLCEELQRIGKLDFVNGPAFVGSIVSTTRLYRDASEYVTSNAQTVAAHSKRRRLIFDLQSGIDKAYANEPIEEIASQVQTIAQAISVHARDSESAQQEFETAKEVRRQRALVEARRIVASENTSTAVVQPNPIGLEELLSRDFPPIEYAIDRLQPKGAKVLFAAQAKAGKTTTVINLIRSLADGELFLNTFRPSPTSGRICLLDLEMTDRQLHHWFREANIRNRSRVVVQQLRGKVASFNILDPIVRSEWAAKLRELEVSYLFFDNLRPLMDALGLDENSDAGRLLVAFDSLVAEAGVSESMIVHHMGHNGNRSRGDSRLRDWPDVEWMLTREKDTAGEVKDLSSPRYFTAYGRDVDFPISQLSFDETARRLVVVGGSPAQAKADAVLADVFGVLAQGPMSKADIEKSITWHSKGPIRDAIDRGVREHVLRMEVAAKGAHMISRGHASPPARRSSPPARQINSAPSSLLADPIGSGELASAEAVESSSPIQGGEDATYSI